MRSRRAGGETLRQNLTFVGFEVVDEMSVLVVGAINIDVLADYDEEYTEHIDRPADISIGVGGTAYNIAANLSQNGVPAELYSTVKKDSIFSEYLREHLEKSEIDTQYVSATSEIDENMFIGFRSGEELESAVTSTGISGVPFDEEVLSSAIESAELIVADCNLSEDQLQTVTIIANETGTPILISGVSESKAARAMNISATIDFFFLNDTQSDSLFADNETPNPDIVNTDTLVVTRGEDGVDVYGGGDYELSAPSIEGDIVNTLGAGDSVISAVAHVLYDSASVDSIDWKQAEEYMHIYVEDVLTANHPRTGSVSDKLPD